MPSLECYGTNAQEEETNALYDELYHLHMNDDNLIYWVKSGENGIISGDYFDEWESDENWLYAFAEMCYGGDISYDDVVRLFTTDTENFEYDEDDVEEDDEGEVGEEEEEEDEWDLNINTNEFIQSKKGGMWLRSMR